VQEADMKRGATTLFLALTMPWLAGAQTAPGAEHKRLEAFVGSWKMDLTMHPSPMGPGGKLTGTETCRMFDGGYHLTCDSSGSGPMGQMKGHVIISWDRIGKRYRYFAVNNMPDAEEATGSVSGNTWTWTSKMDLDGGKSISSRFTLVENSPTVHNMKWEISEDGKAWKVVMEGTTTKSGS
jgi:hypothetical protein